jgi:hypothetical protein
MLHRSKTTDRSQLLQVEGTDGPPNNRWSGREGQGGAPQAPGSFCARGAYHPALDGRSASPLDG